MKIFKNFIFTILATLSLIGIAGSIFNIHDLIIPKNFLESKKYVFPIECRIENAKH